jgi:hypothetical protein
VLARVSRFPLAAGRLGKKGFWSIRFATQAAYGDGLADLVPRLRDRWLLRGVGGGEGGEEGQEQSDKERQAVGHFGEGVCTYTNSFPRDW